MAGRRESLVWVGMEYRYMAAVAALIDEVHQETPGRLRMLAIREHRFPFLTKVEDWNRFNRNTGGTLVEKCCHFFDLMNHITRQRPLRVYASGGQDVNHLDERYHGEVPDILDNAYTVVDFDGGARALLDLCMFAENSLNEVEITATGDKGKVEAFIPENALYVCRRDGSPHVRRTFEVDPAVRQAGAHQGATYHEHLAFIAAIRSGAKPVVSVEDGALAVAVGAAAEQSVREQRAVELAELGF
jgi:predicted dehydrogenase